MIKAIKEILLGIVTFFTVATAAICVIGILVMYGMNVSSWPTLGFMAIILYGILPKTSGTLVVSASIIVAGIYSVIMILSGLFYQPLHYLMSCLLPICATIVMIKGKPIWMWVVISFVYLLIGVYCLFNNDIIGPMGFVIRDRPIDMPAQWNHCYRFFWVGVLMNLVTWSSGIISMVIIFVYVLFMRYKVSFKRLLDLYMKKIFLSSLLLLFTNNIMSRMVIVKNETLPFHEVTFDDNGVYEMDVDFDGIDEKVIADEYSNVTVIKTNQNGEQIDISNDIPYSLIRIHRCCEAHRAYTTINYLRHTIYSEAHYGCCETDKVQYRRVDDKWIEEMPIKPLSIISK